MKRLLRRVQTHLEGLNDVEIDMDVCAFVVDDSIRQTIPGAKAGIPEQLFVREIDGEVELALYINPGIVARLERDNPYVRLHDGNINPYCVAVEGVSHFVFLAYRAQLDRPVTALELEIQAEVDKFVHTWLLLVRQGNSRMLVAKALEKHFFRSYGLHDEVDPSEIDRYRTASEVAQRFCGYLARRFGRDRDTKALKREVRTFFRAGLDDKVRAA